MGFTYPVAGAQRRPLEEVEGTIGAYKEEFSPQPVNGGNTIFGFWRCRAIDVRPSLSEVIVELLSQVVRDKPDMRDPKIFTVDRDERGDRLLRSGQDPDRRHFDGYHISPGKLCRRYCDGAELVITVLDDLCHNFIWEHEGEPHGFGEARRCASAKGDGQKGNEDKQHSSNHGSFLSLEVGPHGIPLPTWKGHGWGEDDEKEQQTNLPFAHLLAKKKNVRLSGYFPVSVLQCSPHAQPQLLGWRFLFHPFHPWRLGEVAIWGRVPVMLGEVPVLVEVQWVREMVREGRLWRVVVG